MKKLIKNRKGENLALALEYGSPFFRPKHAYLKASFKISVPYQASHLAMTEKGEQNKIETGHSQWTLIATHLILFWLWFNSLKLLLKYKSYLKICKLIGYDYKPIESVIKGLT